jgi:hypothetical protein
VHPVKRAPSTTSDLSPGVRESGLESALDDERLGLLLAGLRPDVVRQLVRLAQRCADGAERVGEVVVVHLELGLGLGLGLGLESEKSSLFTWS